MNAEIEKLMEATIKVLRVTPKEEALICQMCKGIYAYGQADAAETIDEIIKKRFEEK